MLRAAVLIISAFLIASCNGDRACDTCLTEAVMYGTVTNEAGEPLQGIEIDVIAYWLDCGVASRGGTRTGIPRSDGSGHYRARLVSRFSPFTATCLRVITNRRGHSDAPTVEFDVREDLDFHVKVRDSLRFDFVLPSESQ